MQFFFYGTLMDPDVLRAVLGPAAVAFVEPAVLRGWRRVGLVGATYPVAVRAGRASQVDGVLAWGIDARGRERLIAYEGDSYFMMRLPIEVRGKTVRAFVFVPRIDRPIRVSGPWDFAEWQRVHKRRWIAGLRARSARRGVHAPIRVEGACA